MAVSKNVRNKRLWALIAGVWLGACLGAWAYAYLHARMPAARVGLRISDLNPNTSYKFIDPLLAARGLDTTTASAYRPLEQTLRADIAEAKNNGSLITASITVRDLRASRGLTINPDEKYSPASLLKVPTMMAYYKIAESDPSILDEAISYTDPVDYNLQEHIVSPFHIQKGQGYSVQSMIDYMIRYSDNNAATTLIDHLNKTNHEKAFFNLFRDLGITELDLNDDFITIQGYSLFFRVLFNATYLTPEWSEKALELLSRTDFNDGIGAGTPHDIQISQKFGEFTLQDTSGKLLKRELHNCGIVYYPDHPYLICVMTKGPDFQGLENFISKIAHDSYVFTETIYPRP